jgi:hypothetical protein
MYTHTHTHTRARARTEAKDGVVFFAKCHTVKIQGRAAGEYSHILYILVLYGGECSVS